MSEAKHIRWWESIFLLLGSALFALQAGLSSPLKSASFDEEYHVAAGYAYLKTGDFRMSLSHPPLLNALSSLPLLLRDDVQLPVDHPSWEQADYFNFSDVFLWQAQSDPQSILEWARWPVILLGTILAAVIFWWTRQMVGVWAGWIALVLAMFDPNLIANARLVTTDLGVTCFLFLTLWRLWHWLRRPSTKNLIFTGLLAGLTMTTKFTGLMVWPIFLIVLLIYPLSMNWKKRIISLFLMGVVAFLVLWGVFRFDISPYPGTNLPLPASFYPYSVLDTFIGIEEQPKTSFLLGQTSPRGWWYYFPVALLLKTSLPLLILTAVGALTMLKTVGWRKSTVVWLPPILFMMLAMTGRITIGYRHILPVVPFLIAMASYSGNLVTGNRAIINKSSISQGVVGFLLLWQMVGTLRIFPHQEAFFNEIAGGPENGANLLVDSNIDWGQDLIALRELMLDQGIPNVYLGYFGTAVPEVYGVDYKPIPGFLRQTAGPEVNSYNPYTPLPGWYAISVTSLQLGLLEQNIDIYDYFRDKEPVFKAGYSINLYKVDYPEEMPVDRLVVRGISVSDMLPEALGIVDGRRLITKWTANDATNIIPFGEEFDPPPDSQPVQANFSDLLTLLGFKTAESNLKPGEPVTLSLFWQRGTEAIPMPAPAKAAPLAAFVHLSGEDPAQIYAQYDGWDTAASTLEPGDIIEQQIILRPPADMPAGEAFLRVGLYSPQTGQRYQRKVGADDFVTIRSLMIQNE